jgi:ligand-binding sensor domain-containing protein/serine phosphatase RsbU (regulator of sigma subunit)
MLTRIFKLIPILLITFCLSTYSQNIPFRNYTTKNGLIQNTVNCIFQDSKGFIWLGTQVGVSRFDGKKFVNYNNTNNLVYNDIKYIAEDGKKRIWMAAENGLNCYENGKISSWNQKKGIGFNSKIGCIISDDKGQIWCGTDNGIFIIQDKKVKHINKSDGLINLNVSLLFKDSKQRIWCASDTGICVFSEEKSILKNVTYQFKDIIPWTFFEDKNHNIWITTQYHGIFRYDGENVTQYLNKETIITGCADKNNTIWAYSFQKGVYYFNGKDFVFDKEIPSDIVYTQIYSDKKGNVWFCSPINGIYRYFDNRYYYYDINNTLISNQIIKLFEDSESNIWFGTNSGVSVYRKVIFEVFTTAHGLPDNTVLSVESDEKGNIWAGTYEGLFFINPNGKTKKVSTKYNNEIFHTIKIQSNKDKGLWLGLMNNGLFNYNQSRVEKIHIPRLSETSSVNDLCLDKYENLWIASEKGVFARINDKYLQYTTKSGLPSNYISAIIADKKNRIWIGTDNGLAYLSDGKIRSVKLSDNVINDITVDGRGFIWVGTDNGLNCIKPSGKDSWNTTTYTAPRLNSNSIFQVLYDGVNTVWVGHEKGLDAINLTTDSIDHYEELEGFTPIETNLGASTLDRFGNLWFGTVMGLVKYDPKANYKDTKPPRTYITAIKVDGGDSTLRQYSDSIDSKTLLPVNLDLPYSYNSITFDYIGLHFTLPEKNRYKYKLEGYDENWSEITDQTSVLYRKLPPGTYTFKVLSANCDGVWTPKPVELKFTVKPPFYRTILAYIIELLIIIGIVIAVIKYRERALLEEKRILEQTVVERTAEIEQQKEALEAYNIELQAQQEEIIAQRDEIEQQKERVEAQRDHISAQNKEITDSIYYAKRIQTAILPTNEEIDKMFSDYFILFRPRDIVSGDFYWYKKRKGKAIIIAADCTGHGVPGAFMSMLGVSLLNEITTRDDTILASDILDNLRESIKSTLSQTGKEGETKDGMDMSLCIIDFENQILQWAGANNPLWQIRDGDFFEYKPDKMPIGIHFGQERPFANHIIEYQKGDAFYIFSDGYADQFGGPNLKKFKSIPFQKLILEVSALSMQEQKKIIEEAHLNWRGDNPQIDDVMVIGFRL